MFRRLYGTFFRLAQQSAPRVFRETFRKNGNRWLAGVIGVQIGAAAVTTLSDAQLAKKPSWYKNDVKKLELAIEETNRPDYIKNKEVLEDVKNVFLKYVHLNNPDLLWRLSRVLTEEADLATSKKDEEALLRKAVEVGKKAVFYERQPRADLHKWYAVALTRLMEFDKKLRKSSQHLAKEHYKRALELNSQDQYTWHLLGVENFKQKEYAEALKCFEKAEEISPDFALLNHLYLGKVSLVLKDKSRAIEELKKVFKSPVRSKADALGRSEARSCLSKLRINREEYDPTEKK